MTLDEWSRIWKQLEPQVYAELEKLEREGAMRERISREDCETIMRERYEDDIRYELATALLAADDALKLIATTYVREMTKAEMRVLARAAMLPVIGEGTR